MKTVFPTATGCNGMFVVGSRSHPLSGTAQEVGVVLLKRHYRIEGGNLVPQADPIGLLTTDRQMSVSYDGDSFKITDFESDMALYKPRVDIVVRRHYSSGDTCQLHVTPPGGSDQLWLSRAGPAPETSDQDLRYNMFGWESRALSPRKDLATPFDNGFFNSYRRNFAETGYPATSLVPGSAIRISRSGSSTLELRVGEEVVRAYVFIAEQRGPDRKRFWCRRALPTLRADTVVISPESETAYVVWRGTWDYGLFPRDRYRELEVHLTETAE